MQQLKDRILKEAAVASGHVLKVDSFLNHQMDVALFYEIGKEFHRLFKQDGITKIVTVEASGIGIACLAALFFKVPVVFAKKQKTANLVEDVYTTSVSSFTHGKLYDIVISKEFLNPEDRILLIDDFLANGCALNGLRDLVEQAEATLVGAGIVIEKGFQGGGDQLRAEGMRIESLAVIEKMDKDGIVISGE
ncbi:MAG: xanthine phosphoribosyltransferase [Oscillospiraceae bacterium]|nr:xanthine phosphoribosyltransferase [Oscillospiraceae bacterium]